MKYEVTVLIEIFCRVLVISSGKSSILVVVQSPSWKQMPLFEGVQEVLSVCECLGLEIDPLGDGKSPTYRNYDIYRQNIL